MPIAGHVSKPSWLRQSMAAWMLSGLHRLFLIKPRRPATPFEAAFAVEASASHASHDAEDFVETYSTTHYSLTVTNVTRTTMDATGKASLVTGVKRVWRQGEVYYHATQWPTHCSFSWEIGGTACRWRVYQAHLDETNTLITRQPAQNSRRTSLSVVPS